MILVILGLVVIFFILSNEFGGISGNVVRNGFEVDSFFLKVSLKQGNSAEKQISIKSDIGGEFSISLNNIEGVSLKEDNFILQPGGSSKITIKFNSENVKEGVYAGKLRVVGPKDEFFIPIIFEVESKDVFYDVNLDIPPKYTIVSPGEEIVAQLKVFDLSNIITSNINLEYLIKGFDGEILSSESGSISLSGNVEISKSISLPKDIREGEYVVIAVASYKSSVGVSSELISIKQPTDSVAFSPQNKNYKNAFLWVVEIFVLVGIVIVAGYLIRAVKAHFSIPKNKNLEWTA